MGKGKNLEESIRVKGEMELCVYADVEAVRHLLLLA